MHHVLRVISFVEVWLVALRIALLHPRLIFSILSATFMGVIGTYEKWSENIADFPSTSFILCLHVVSTTGVVHSLLVLSGKSSYADRVMQQCLACTCRNWTPSTMCPECSDRLIYHISVSALLLLFMIFLKIWLPKYTIPSNPPNFFPTIFQPQLLIQKCIKKISYSSSIHSRNSS